MCALRRCRRHPVRFIDAGSVSSNFIRGRPIRGNSVRSGFCPRESRATAISASVFGLRLSEAFFSVREQYPFQKAEPPTPAHREPPRATAPLGLSGAFSVRRVVPLPESRALLFPHGHCNTGSATVRAAGSGGCLKGRAGPKPPGIEPGWDGPVPRRDSMGRVRIGGSGSASGGWDARAPSAGGGRARRGGTSTPLVQMGRPGSEAGRETL
jgi:hypothetical protein